MGLKLPGAVSLSLQLHHWLRSCHNCPSDPRSEESKAWVYTPGTPYFSCHQCLKSFSRIQRGSRAEKGKERGKGVKEKR